MRRLKLRSLVGCASVVLLAITVSACGGSGGNHAPLTVAVFQPFTGPDATFGPEQMAGCAAAVRVINGAGGVLGHRMRCTAVDTKGDPADAVPAADQMLATTSNLVGVIGPSSDEADATVPVIDAAKVPMFADTGEASFDHSTKQYFYRLIPPDDAGGYAMAAWAKQRGLMNAAAVFGNDIGSQGTVPTMTKGYEALGGQLVVNQAIELDKSSYRSEVESVLAAKPDAIFTEADPQTSAAYFSEILQLGGHLPPVIGTNLTLQADWVKAVSRAVGASTFARMFVGVQPVAPSTGVAYDAYKGALLASGASVPNPQQWASNSYTISEYDATIVMALAMDAAKSVKPGVYNASIVKVTAPSAGATVVHTFSAGEKALAAGHSIQYVGAGGPILFNRYHNSVTGFEIATFDPATQQIKPQGVVTAAQLHALER